MKRFRWGFKKFSLLHHVLAEKQSMPNNHEQKWRWNPTPEEMHKGLRFSKKLRQNSTLEEIHKTLDLTATKIKKYNSSFDLLVV